MPDKVSLVENIKESIKYHLIQSGFPVYTVFIIKEGSDNIYSVMVSYELNGLNVAQGLFTNSDMLESHYIALSFMKDLNFNINTKQFETCQTK